MTDSSPRTKISRTSAEPRQPSPERRRSRVETATSRIGAGAERPFKIYCCFADDLAFNIQTASVAASVAAQFSFSRTTFEVPTLSGDVKQLLNMFPFDFAVHNAPSPDKAAQIRHFWPAPGHSKTDRYDASHAMWQDFLLSPSMVAETQDGGRDTYPLRVPADVIANLDSSLSDTPILSSNWYFLFDSSAAQITGEGPEGLQTSMLTARDHVIHDLGGQVIRLRSKDQSPWKAVPGYAEFLTSNCPLTVQAYLAMRARAVWSANPVTSALAASLRVPRLERGLSPDMGNGRATPESDLMNAALLEVFAATTDCPRWRPAWDTPRPIRNAMSWPLV